MEADRASKKRTSVFKKLERYLSLNKLSSSKPPALFTKSRSWHSTTKERQRTAPHGCFSVYVGPEKQRFVVRTEFANHPLFKMLLEDAELEYGFSSEGPLLLPCDVGLFCKVLAEMDCVKELDSDGFWAGFGYGGCSPFSPARRLRKSGMAGCGGASYGLLTPPRLVKINQF